MKCAHMSRLLLALALLCSPALATADGEESGAEAQAEQKAEPESTEDAADLAKLSLSIARPTSLTFSDGAYVVDLTQTQSLTLKWQYSAAADSSAHAGERAPAGGDGVTKERQGVVKTKRKRYVPSQCASCVRAYRADGRCGGRGEG